jgi:TP901 family phage tail tape measure protein
MDNPIKYSDLIKPDDSITTLINQLTALIEKYGEVKTKIQGDAAALAKSLENVSSATEEQRKTIESTTTQSDKLAKAYENVNVAERETYRRRQQVIQAVKEEQSIDKLVVQLNNSKEGSYNRLSAQYRLNKIRLNEMSDAERHGTQSGRDLENETRRIYERMSDLQKATGKYTLEVGHYENAMRALPAPLQTLTRGFGQMGSQLRAIGASDLPLASKALRGFSTIALGTVGIILQFVNYLTSAYKTMRDFEQANANLSTILGVTREEMKALTDSALSLGRSTEYTASQVTQLQTELAKLGFGQGSIIAMQKPVLEFATAVGADLAEAAAVAGSTLRAFNLTSSETDEVLATLAVATNKSALSFARIRDSIGTVFPVANAYGLTVKDTTALLGALANAGFDASSAATATRNILLNLANANGKLAKSLGGSVNTFDDIINGLIELRKRGINVAESLELTDKRSVAAFSAFISGAESARELRNSLNDVSGELERISAERLDTVEGSTKLLQSAWEGLTLAFEKSNGTIKSTIDWLTKLVTQTQRLLFPTDTFISEIADKYTAEFQKYYKKNGAKAAQAYIDYFQKFWEKQASDTKYQADTKTGFLAKWLGLGDKQMAAKTAQNTLVALRQAADVVLTQIENDTKEAADRAGRDAEQAAQATSQRTSELSKEQKKAIEAAKKQRIADRKAVIDAIQLEISVTAAGTDKMLSLRQDKINAQRQLELEQNRQKVESEKQDESAINAKYDQMLLDDKKAFENELSAIRQRSLQAELNAINLQIAVTRKGSDEMLNLKLAAIEKQREIEIEKNKQTDVKLRPDEAAINAKYDQQAKETSIDFRTQLAMELLDIQQDFAQSEFDLLDKNERQKTQFRLQMERERLQKILELNRKNGKDLTAEQVATIQNQIAAIDKAAKSTPYKNLYEVLGISLKPEQQDAFNTAINATVDGINTAIDAWIKEADAAINAANARVDAAQRALDAEIEARNNGYANNVVQAQKELDLEKQQQQKVIEVKQKAQKAQLAMDAITQASSLITASANLWASLSPIPLIGPALAIAAIATMWGSFLASKVKAAQVTKETYGDGTVELLQGGSHASGNDIDLGMTKDGKNRRAEGGEYFAIINKRNSRRFGSIIPDVINSFNDGTFADKYQRANSDMAGVALAMVGSNATDVSALERGVDAIRKQGERSRFVDSDGNTIEVYKNVTRKILKS